MNGIPTESTSTSSHTPVNIEDLEKEAKELDEELKKMIKRGGKNGVNLDAIEERSEKRKRIREAITQARRQTQKEENRHRESKKSNEKQSLIPYKPEKKEEYTVIVRNLRSRLKTKEEMYKYLLTFGDICRINYMDRSRIEKRINPTKDIMVSYTTEGGLLRAAHCKHRDLQVCIPDMVENKEVFYEQGKLQHSRQDEESSQDNWGHTGRRHQEDKWSLRSC